MTEAPKRIETKESRMIAGVLFDFMGFLASREKVTTLSSHHNASAAVEAIQVFAAQRNLSLEEADVKGWQDVLA
jgi:hypothetical protein